MYQTRARRPLTGPADPAGPSTDAEPTDAAPAETADGLTKETAEAFLACMDDDGVEEIMDGIVDGLGVEDEQSPEAIKMAIEKAAENDDLSEIVKGYGFKDAAEWADAAKVVVPARGAAMLTVAAEAMGMDPETDEFKQMAAESDSDLAAMAEAFGTPSEADLAIVTEVMAEQMAGGMEDMGDAPADESTE